VQPLAVLRGLGLGVGVALLFAITPLLELRRLSPARVLRADAEPLPGSLLGRLAAALVLVAGLSVLATAQSGDARLGLGFTAGVVVAALVLAGAARLVVRGVGALPRRRLGFALRHGLAALARPSAGTTSALVALGLGVLAVLGMRVVETQLREQLRTALPADAPTAFLVDVQPDQWAAVQEALAEAGAERVDSVPMVMARLAALDGRPVADVAAELSDDDERRWVFTREQRLTWADELPEANRVVAGSFHADDSREREISIEADFAEDLGVGLGSTVTVDVQGVPIDFVVTSLREVDWGSFRINFFFVVEPGVLEDAPHSRLAAARLDETGTQRLQDRLAVAAPNVTVVKVRDVLDRVARVLGVVGLGVRVLGTFTVLAGLAILAGVVSAGSARRGREVALLKTMGATRAQVAGALIAEQALIGLVAGTIGAAGGALLAWAVLTRGMKLAYELPVGSSIAAVAVSIALAAATGVLASLGALRSSPAAVLRRG
jgi:putative ABC transport system permease protein